MLKVTVFKFWRIKDHGLSRRSVLIQAITFDVLVLNHEQPGLRPFALRVKADFPNDGVKLVFVDVVSKLVIV